MAPALLQLTYISTRSQEIEVSEVDRILSISRLNNRRASVTGFLLYNGRRFLQHLEGPSEAVEETYERISRDPRHHALVLLGRRDVEERVFARWSMAFQRVDSALPERRLPLVEQVEAMLVGVDPQISSHFIGYAQLTAEKDN